MLEFKAGKSRPDGRDGPRYELSLRYEELGGALGEEAVLEMSCSSCGAVAGSSGEMLVGEKLKLTKKEPVISDEGNF